MQVLNFKLTRLTYPEVVMCIGKIKEIGGSGTIRTKNILVSGNQNQMDMFFKWASEQHLDFDFKMLPTTNEQIKR